MTLLIACAFLAATAAVLGILVCIISAAISSAYNRGFEDGCVSGRDTERCRVDRDGRRP